MVFESRLGEVEWGKRRVRRCFDEGTMESHVREKGMGRRWENLIGVFLGF